MQQIGQDRGDYGRRNLSVTGFVIVVLVWMAIVKGVGLLTEDKADVVDGRLLTAHQLLWTLIVPIGAACAFVYVVIAVLGWWRPVFYDPKPVRRWVWVVPIVFTMVILGGINYGLLADRGAEFALALIASMLLVGLSEEGMFRVIGVTTFRRNGFSEGKVAFWTSLLFGLVHVGNVIGGDSRAFAQAVVVSFAGYFFYLIRRVSRSNILNTVLHAGFDLTLIGGTLVLAKGHDPYPGVLLGFLAYIVCGIIVFVRRHKIEPESTLTTTAVATT